MDFRESQNVSHGSSSTDDGDIYSQLGLDRRPVGKSYVDPYEEQRYVAEEIPEELRELIEKKAKNMPNTINPDRVFELPKDGEPPKYFNIPRTALYRQSRAHRRRALLKERAPGPEETKKSLREEYGNKEPQQPTPIESSNQTPISQTTNIICNPHYCDKKVWLESEEIMNIVYANDKNVYKFYTTWYPIYFANRKRDVEEMYLKAVFEKVQYSGGVIEEVILYKFKAFFKNNSVHSSQRWPKNNNVIKVVCKFNDMDEDAQQAADASAENQKESMTRESLLSYASDSLRCSLIFYSDLDLESDSMKLEYRNKTYASTIIGLMDMLFYLFSV